MILQGVTMVKGDKCKEKFDDSRVRRQVNVHCLKCAESVVASYFMN